MLQPVCIGSVLWDVVGNTGRRMEHGDDVPGVITRQAGGVVYNIAERLTKLGLQPILLTMLGNDPEGQALVNHCNLLQMQTEHIYIAPDLPTDIYMAIEDADGLVAAIADAHSLEKAGNKILTPLEDGRLGSPQSPFQGMVILDGNLTEDLLGHIAQSPLFHHCDLRVIPASPGKAHRLAPFFQLENATLYVNRVEAKTLTGQNCENAYEAAKAMIERGAKRCIVTDGAAPVCDARQGSHAILKDVPKVTQLCRVTGAGDTFMAAHAHAERLGKTPEAALTEAIKAASDFVSTRNDHDGN